MRMHLACHNFDLTPSIKTYAEEKLGSLSKFVERFDIEGDVEVHATLERTTSHHHKGEIFKASADLHLPGKSLHGEALEEDIYAAINAVKDKLAGEIEKYRTEHLPHA